MASQNFPAGLRVLVVDDDPLCLRIVEKMLKRCQYTGKSAVLDDLGTAEHLRPFPGARKSRPICTAPFAVYLLATRLHEEEEARLGNIRERVNAFARSNDVARETPGRSGRVPVTPHATGRPNAQPHAWGFSSS